MSPVVEATAPSLTVDAVLVALEYSYTRSLTALRHLGPHLDSGPDTGGWTPRQVLTHVIGSWELDAVRIGHFLDQRARDSMLIIPHHHYIVESLGGKTVVPPMEIPGNITMAMFTDPEGHLIGLIKG